MNFSWAGIQQSIREFWGKLSRPQKIITVVAPLLVAITLFSLIFWAGRPQYVALFTKMSDADAGAITTKLKDLKVNYQLADNGSTILVPKSQAAEVRLELANAGLPQGSKFSFDSLNQVHLGETDADRKLRYVLGLQNELETTLKTLAGVQDARVHIVMPDPSLFVEKEKPATAAVTLSLAPGAKIAEEQVKAIANLLAGSVEGLQPENVTIVDTNGNTLSDVLSKKSDPKKLTATQLQIQQQVESDLQKSIQSMLDRVFPGKTVVRANAVLNFDQVSINSTKNGPGAVVSEQNSTDNSTSGTGQGTVPGTMTNVPGYQTPTANGTNSSSQKTNTTRNYQVDTTQEQRVVAPGTIQRLSVSVMADADAINQAQLSQIQSIVASASGIDLTRGDQIQVASMPFDKTEQQQEQKLREAAARNQQNMKYTELGIGVLLALVFIFLVLRMRSKHKAQALAGINGEFQPVPLAAAEELLLAQQEAEKEAEKQADLKIAQKRKKSAEDIERQKVKESVEKYTENNPEEVARLIRTWLSEEK